MEDLYGYLASRRIFPAGLSSVNTCTVNLWSCQNMSTVNYTIFFANVPIQCMINSSFLVPCKRPLLMGARTKDLSHSAATLGCNKTWNKPVNHWYSAECGVVQMAAPSGQSKSTLEGARSINLATRCWNSSVQVNLIWSWDCSQESPNLKQSPG